MKREFLEQLELDDEIIGRILSESETELEQYRADCLEQQEAAAAWQKRYEDGQREQQEREERLSFERRVEKALEDAGAKSVKAVRALLDPDRISVGEDGISGLEEQIETLRQEQGFLFSDRQPVPVAVAESGGAEPRERSLFSVIRSAAGL